MLAQASRTNSSPETRQTCRQQPAFTVPCQGESVYHLGGARARRGEDGERCLALAAPFCSSFPLSAIYPHIKKKLEYHHPLSLFPLAGRVHADGCVKLCLIGRALAQCPAGRMGGGRGGAALVGRRETSFEGNAGCARRYRGRDVQPNLEISSRGYEHVLRGKYP